MSVSDKNEYDMEKGDALEGPPAVDGGVYTGVHESAVPGDGIYAKFDYYNRKLERKLGIETVRLSMTRESGRFAD